MSGSQLEPPFSEESKTSSPSLPESSDDEFQDATSEPLVHVDISHGDDHSGLVALQTAVDLMNNNKYLQAERMLQPLAQVSMYHATAYSTVLFLQAGFSADREIIERATVSMSSTISLCDRRRKNRGTLEYLSSWFFGSRLEGYTLGELQAEVLFAEANLLYSLLTFIQDESLLSFIKGSLRIRNCFSLYKQLYQWLKTCRQEGTEIEPNFAAGVLMGYGVFNLFISILPARVLRLLEFVGFSGNRDVGLAALEEGAGGDTFRAPLCTTYLLVYHTVVLVMFGIGEVDVPTAERLLRPQLEKYPSSVQFLYFRGRVQLMSGTVDQAIESFSLAEQAQSQWAQVHHLCWWELVWCHFLKGEWSQAEEYADRLYRSSKWSKATFLYLKACCMLMRRTESGDTRRESGNSDRGKEEEEEEEELRDIMRKIPPLKLRIAGKSIPFEKFAVSKSERYLGGARLPLCALEMLYGNNGIVLLARNEALLKQQLALIWTALASVRDSKASNPCYADDLVVVLLMQGTSFRVLKRYDEAEKCFLEILKNSGDVVHDHYAVAAAGMELGLVYTETERWSEAKKQLERAKNDYKGYHLESRIHFRIHAGLGKTQRNSSQR